MKDLRLSLKKQWFDLTSPEGKTEDYREIDEYWCRRLLYKIAVPKGGYWSAMRDILRGDYKCEGWRQFTGGAPIFRVFDTNTMTLGYPKAGDHTKQKVFKHAGIEIRTGRPEWGAEPGKLYFVIKHGEQQK